MVYIPIKSSDIQKTRKEHAISNRCVSKQCLQTLGKEIPAQKLIVGSIKKIEKEHERLLGTEGKKKYLLQTKQDVIFVISLQLIDGKTVKTIKRLSLRTKESRIYRIRRTIIKTFQPYYTEPPKPKPVIITKPEPKPEQVVIKAEPQAKLIPLFIPGLGVQCILTQPLNRFSNIVTKGLGLSIDVTGKQLYQTQFFGTVNIRFSSFFIKNSDINYFIMSGVSIKGGYEFKLYPEFSLTPWLATGYLFHQIDDIARENTFNYFDPFIEIGGTAGYYIRKDIALTFSPSYVLFFEHGGDTGSYLQFGIGVSKMF